MEHSILVSVPSITGGGLQIVMSRSAATVLADSVVIGYAIQDMILALSIA